MTRKISLGTSHEIRNGKIVKEHKLQAGKSRRVLEARAKREAERWQAAEHYSPIPKENDQ